MTTLPPPSGASMAPPELDRVSGRLGGGLDDDDAFISEALDQIELD